jgi:very-short-patch-repair endonuclease
VDRFVLDFYCVELKIAIEVDGDSHLSSDAIEYDGSREEYIKRFGIIFLRFTNAEIRNDLSAALNKILETIQKREKSFLSPP